MLRYPVVSLRNICQCVPLGSLESLSCLCQELVCCIIFPGMIQHLAQQPSRLCPCKVSRVIPWDVAVPGRGGWRLTTLSMCIYIKQGKKSGYVPALNSSKSAIHMHFEHLLSLPSNLESLDFLRRMRDVGYSLFNYVWLYRMTTVVSCTPGHLSGAVWGIYAILCVQRDSTSQSALGTSTFPVLVGGWLALPALATGSCVVAQPVLPWCSLGRLQWEEVGGGWTGSPVSIIRHLDNSILKSQVPETRGVTLPLAHYLSKVIMDANMHSLVSNK